MNLILLQWLKLPTRVKIKIHERLKLAAFCLVLQNTALCKFQRCCRSQAANGQRARLLHGLVLHHSGTPRNHRGAMSAVVGRASLWLDGKENRVHSHVFENRDKIISSRTIATDA